LLVEFLVLLNMRLLTLLPLLRLIENEFLISAIVVLLFELGDSILSHLCLDILAFALTSVSMILKHLTSYFKLMLVLHFSYLNESNTLDNPTHPLSHVLNVNDDELT